MKQILIVDDNILFRYSLKAVLIEDGKYVLDTVSDASEALENLKLNNYDLILLDIHLPDINGVLLAKKILKKNASQKIMFITGLEHNTYLQEIVNIKTSGFILKDIEPSDLKFAVDYVLKGGHFYGNQILKDVIDIAKSKINLIEGNKTINNTIVNKLSPREMQIVKYVSEGLTSKEISNKMFLSKRTVDAHRFNLLRKLNLKNSSELIAILTGNKL